MKRCIRGTDVSVEPLRLSRYLDEQAFRYNERKHANGCAKTDGERFIDVAGSVAGKRLTCSKLTGKDAECPPTP